MKHIKKHPINDKAQKLSKDMKKQDLVKPKTDKKLDADDHLSDPKISKRYVKPSNKKLSSEKHLAGKKAKKVNESIDQLNDSEIEAVEFAEWIAANATSDGHEEWRMYVNPNPETINLYTTKQLYQTFKNRKP